MEDLQKHPEAGSITGEYLVSEDGSVKVPALVMLPKLYPEVRQHLTMYQWRDADFLLTSYPKNGTDVMWEVMTMLLERTADHVKEPPEMLMIDTFPINKSRELFPSPRVLNTQYRTDVLPAQFRKGKTVIVMRNAKDVCVSNFHYEVKLLASISPLYEDLANMTLGDFVKGFLFDKDRPYGSYFDYTEYMWTLRDDPNHFLVFYEDLKAEPVATIQKVDAFMGTNASPELVQNIADAIDFDKKKAKVEGRRSAEFEKLRSEERERSGAKGKMNNANKAIFREGDVGVWKNHFTVADNEMFDEFLAGWEGGKDIPFKY